MKKNIYKIGLIILMAGTYSLQAQSQSITIDGDLSDWDAVPYLHTNAEGIGGTLTAIKSVPGADDIFFYLEGTTALTFGQFDLYINTDNNALTGFTPVNYPEGAGAELLIQGTVSSNTGTVNNYTGTGTDFIWGWLKGYTSADMSFSALIDLTSKKAIEFSIKKSLLGTVSPQISIALTDVVSWTAAGTMPAEGAGAKYLTIETSPGTLPVELVSFDVKKTTGGAELSWASASEKDNSHFDIYRSADGIQYEKIASVPGSTAMNFPAKYKYIDPNPLAGISYYRLNQVDQDGTDVKLASAAFKADNRDTDFWVRILESGIELVVYSDKNTASSFRLSDLSGKVLINRKINLNSGYQTLTFPAVPVKAGIGIAVLQSERKNLAKKIILN